MANFWLPMSYGHAPIYALTIAGCPVVFTERALGKTLPAGWTAEDASLVIDDSAEIGTGAIDRDRGCSTGLDFTFKLLDTPAVRGLMCRFQKSATLAGSMPWNCTVGAGVIDVTGWTAPGYFYAGAERIHYSGIDVGANAFTGLTRGCTGTVPVDHNTSTTGQIITDAPRFWRGREVVLWAVMADPSGWVCGDELLGAQAKMLWRGVVSGGPDRAVDGFQFAAQSIDRVLDVPLAGKVTGDVTGFNEMVAIWDTAWTLSVTMDARDASDAPGSVFWHTVPIQPFTATTPGTLMSAQAIRDAISAAWQAKVAALGFTADLGHLVHKDQGLGHFLAAAVVKVNAAISRLSWSVWVDQQMVSYGGEQFTGGMPPGAGDYQANLAYDAGTDADPAQPPTAITLAITEGNIADVPATGMLTLKAGSSSAAFTYAVMTADQGNLYLGGLQPAPNQTIPAVNQLYDSSGKIAATAEVMQIAEGQWADVLQGILHNSAFGDTKGQGYGIPLANLGTFGQLKGGVLAQVTAQVPTLGKSFTDYFGGILGLLRLAVVARPDGNGNVVLTCVDTGPSADFATVIGDADLLCNDGDPVVSVKKADSANAITVECPSLVDGVGALKYVFNDMASVDAEGKRELTYSIGVKAPKTLQQLAQDAVTSHFSFDPTLQAVELRVHPATDVEPGDSCWLTTTHPALWTWSTNPGQVGYDGAGRCTGKKLNLKSCVVTLTLLVDGATRVHALCPAAQVSAYDTATNPTWVDVPLAYKPHFETALAKAAAASETLHALHYQPGQTEAASMATITAVADVGGHCRLAIAYTGTMSTPLRSTLTLPATSATTEYQRNFAHVADLSAWS